MIDAKQDGSALLALISDVCNKTSNIDHYMTRSMEALYSITQLSGSKMSLGDYYKRFPLECVWICPPFSSDYLCRRYKGKYQI